MKRLLINGKQAALKDNTVIQTSVQSFTTDLTSRLISYTNEITLPYVQANQDIFESCEVIAVVSDIPYKKVEIQYYEGGTAIIPYGFGILSEADSKGYKLQIYGNTKSFFDALGDKTLNDIDFDVSPITWDDATIASVRKKENNIVLAPFIQYGQIDMSASAFDIGKTLPSVSYDKTIEQIFKNAGFKFNGSVFDNQEYKDMFIPYSRPEFNFGAVYKYQYKWEITKSHDIDPYDAYASGSLHVSDITFDTPEESTFGNFGSDLPRSGKQDITFECKVQVITGVLTATGRCIIIGYPSPGGISTIYASNTIALTSGSKSMKIEINGLNIPQPSQIFSIFFQVTNNTNLVDNGTIVRFMSGTLQNKVYVTNQETTDPIFYPEEVLPEIKQIDFIKDWAMMFGLVFDVGTTDYPGDTVIVKSFNEILNGTEEVDWSYKRNLAVRPSISFAYQGYGRSNRFKWADDITESFGEIAIPNETLENVVDYYQSLFKATPEVTFTNGASHVITCIELEQIDDPGTWNYLEKITDQGYRLAYVERNDDIFGPGCYYNGVFVDDYDIGKFATRLDWGRFLTLYYKRLIDCLQAVKIVTVQYTLTSEDVNMASSPFQIIRDGNQKYLCMNIDRWIEGIKCSTTLFLIR